MSGDINSSTSLLRSAEFGHHPRFWVQQLRFSLFVSHSGSMSRRIICHEALRLNYTITLDNHSSPALSLHLSSECFAKLLKISLPFLGNGLEVRLPSFFSFLCPQEWLCLSHNPL